MHNTLMDKTRVLNKFSYEDFPIYFFNKIAYFER